MASVRNLDVAQSATANVMELHNMVASMKKLVKTAKVYVVRRLIQRLKSLRDKRDSERKISNIAREIEIINGLECDKVSKYALGSTTTFADICKMQDCSLEMKALARLTNNFVIQNKVDEFRKAHNDWQSLALFMMTKQSGRRFRKHKNIKDKQTVIANRQTGDAMITDFVKQKFVGKNVEEIIGKKITSHGIKSDKSHMNSDKIISRKSKKSAETSTDMSKSLFDLNCYENQIGPSINRHEVHNKLSGETITNEKKFMEECLKKNDVNSKNVGSIENNPKKKDENYHIDNSDAGVSFNVCVPTVTVKQMLNDESMLPKNKHENIQQGELIVKRLNLSEMVEDDEVRSFWNENITNVEVGDESDKICTANNIRDGFFMGGENSAEEDDTEGETYGEYYREPFPNKVNWKWQNIKSSFVSLKQDQSNGNSPMQQTKHLSRNMKFSTKNNREFPHAHIERKTEFGIKSDKYLAVNTICIYAEDNTADGSSMRTVNLQKISIGKDVEHPSWVASRKRKGETKIGTFCGKKIKFDNSD